MEIMFTIVAAIAGAFLGWEQHRLLKRIIADGKPWLIAIKLSLWALPMVAAAVISVWVLISLVVSATASFLFFGYTQWRRQRNGG